MSLSKHKQVLGDMVVCTYTKTKSDYANQAIYRCRTCKLDGNLGMCYICLTKCHQGHDTFYAYFGSFFCDCGEKGNSFCKALRSSVVKPSKNTTLLHKESDTSSTFECPVCFDYMCTPIHMCQRGHNVCGACKVKIKECPICRGALTDARNLGMESLCHALEIHCNDCERNIVLSSYNSHKKQCPMRDYECPIHTTCTWSGKWLDIFQHWQGKHKAHILNGGFHTLQLNDIGEKNHSQVWMIDTGVTQFLFHCDYITEEKIFQATVKSINPLEEEIRYKYIITFFAEHSEETITFQKRVRPEWETFQDCYNNKQCVTLAMEQAVDILRLNTLSFKLKLETK